MDAMNDKFRRTIIFSLLWSLILSHQNRFVAGDGQGGAGDTSTIQEEKPSLAKTLTDSISNLRKYHENSWGKAKAIIHAMQIQFFPPNVDFRGGNKANADAGAGEKVKEAAKKSTSKSKMAVEESAKSAAEAVHKTAEKVKVKLHDEM
ncbi:hypothetical protein Pint_26958 [Pistacia integerrima]|uniref:Uncharacterized protein n=1 Tax=Pistacia integerrima TaxID=434235 RepID=A0ACC0YV32_9ROSI|nr:hypothetical protein Pint_26958 [Pistacia integerrima]